MLWYCLWSFVLLIFFERLELWFEEYIFWFINVRDEKYGMINFFSFLIKFLLGFNF